MQVVYALTCLRSQVAFLGSISGRVGQLSRAYKKSLLRRGRKKEESREKREWMSMCRRVEEGSTVRTFFSFFRTEF